MQSTSCYLNVDFMLLAMRSKLACLGLQFVGSRCRELNPRPFATNRLRVKCVYVRQPSLLLSLSLLEKAVMPDKALAGAVATACLLRMPMSDGAVEIMLSTSDCIAIAST